MTKSILLFIVLALAAPAAAVDKNAEAKQALLEDICDAKRQMLDRVAEDNPIDQPGGFNPTVEQQMRAETAERHLQQRMLDLCDRYQRLYGEWPGRCCRTF